MKEKCHDCGIIHGEGDGLSCPSCKTTLCKNCHQKRMDKEQREIETLREGDAHTRLQILCPSCQSPMVIL